MKTYDAQPRVRRWWRACWAVGLVSLIAASCSDPVEERSVSPCSGGLSQDCGATCTPSSQSEACGPGLYCGHDGQCTADCVPGDQRCGQGQTCSPEGRCIDDVSKPDATLVDGGAGTGGTGGDDACIQQDVTFSNQVPTVVLLIDQSGSMDTDFSGEGPRWNVLRNALMDPATGLVSRLESDVRFGLTMYTGPAGVVPPGSDQATEPSGEACPQLASVSFALDNYETIAGQYQPNDWKNETPTGESIRAVVDALEPYPEPGPKVIVLATDGEPDRCERPNPRPEFNVEDNGAARQLVIDEVRRAHGSGISTFVISVGEEIGEDHLRQVANVGQGLPIDEPGDRFYVANNQDQLESAFDAIIDGVRSCVFGLDGEVEAGQEANGNVRLDGAMLGYEDVDGWRLNGPSQLELVGAACQAIQSGDHDLSIQFPCGAFIPTPR